MSGRRHGRDTLSLMSGLLLVLLALAFLVADTTDVDVDARWVAPAALLAVGAAGLLSTLRRTAPPPAD